MAIYFPPLVCGRKSILKVKQTVRMYNRNNVSFDLQKDETYYVDQIKGYAYYLKSGKTKQVVRVLNGKLLQYFKILEKIDVDSDLISKQAQKATTAVLNKNFEIKDIVHFKAGKQFLHIQDVTKTEIFHDLYTLNGEKILRLKNVEFIDYFKIES